METKTIKVKKTKRENIFKTIDPELLETLKDKNKTKELIKKDKIKNFIDDAEMLNLRNQVKTKKLQSLKKKNILSQNRILQILQSLKKLVDNNDHKNINIFFKKLKKYQIVPILFHISILKTKYSKAPLPILKNILYNLITGNINLIN